VIDDADHMTTFTKPVFIESIDKFLAKHRKVTGQNPQGQE
jgi:hypothetical protein